MEPPRRIASLLYPEVMSLDITGPLQVFASANVERERHGLAPIYELLVLGEQAGPVATSAGIRICADQAWREIDPTTLDTLLVPGGPGVPTQCENIELLHWLAAAEPQVRRLGSVCSGALILAAAGVLDGRPATTHWANVDELCAGFPEVLVQGDRLHTYDPQRRNGDDHVFTSAGVTAGIDLALALIEDDLGGDVARRTAQQLVVHQRRPGGQSQFSALVDMGGRNGRFAELMDWMRARLAEPLPVEKLAAQAAMSPRNFARAFTAETGTTPAKAVERLRLEAARTAVETGHDPIDRVAEDAGFGDPERMRRAFLRAFGQPPQALRRAARA